MIARLFLEKNLQSKLDHKFELTLADAVKNFKIDEDQKILTQASSIPQEQLIKINFANLDLNSKPSKKPRKKKRKNRTKMKFEEKILQIKRVTKVVKGGKIMTFRAVVIIGNRKGKVGVGVGRAEDVNQAIEKAIINGKKKIITVPLTINYSLPHIIKLSYRASSIMLRPASQGTGVIAGGALRPVLELAGVKNILAKQFGSKNILNNAKATILALSKLDEKIFLAKNQSKRKFDFYKKIMKKVKNETLFN